MDYTVHIHDVDLNNHMSPASVMRLMHICADNQMRTDTPSMESVRDMGIALIMNRLTMEFQKDIDRGDHLLVSTWPCEASAFMMPRNYTITRNGECIAGAESTWAVVDIKTRRLLKSDRLDFSRYTFGDRGPYEHESVPADAKMEEAGVFPVYYEFCDLNYHMNNTRYLDMLCNFVPDIEKRFVTKLCLHYRNEAPLNSVITVKRCIQENRVLFQTEVNGKPNVDAVLYFKER